MTLPTKTQIWDNRIQRSATHLQRDNTTFPAVYIAPGMIVISEKRWFEMAANDVNTSASAMMSLIQSIDGSVCKVKEELYSFKQEFNAFKKETKADASEMKQDVSTLKGGMKPLNERVDRIDRNLNDMRVDNARLEGKVDVISARFDAQQANFNRNLTIFGIVITVAIAFIQYLKG